MDDIYDFDNFDELDKFINKLYLGIFTVLLIIILLSLHV